MDRVLKNKKAICLFLLPALVAYTVFVFLPMCQSIVYTFFEGTPNVNFDFVGLKNYQKLVNDPDFVSSFVITLKYLVTVASSWAILGLLSALLFAYGMSKKYVNLARTIIYLPVVIPGVGVAAMFSKILEMEPNYGLINSLLSLVGLGDWVQPWIGQSSTALSTVCAADIWRGFGYYTIIFYAGLINVPKELEEAARIDGCGTLMTIRKIVMPILRPVTIMCITLAVMHALRVYDMPTILTKGGPGRSTQVLSMYMYKIAFTKWKYGYGSAVAIVILAMSLFMTQTISLFERERKP